MNIIKTIFEVLVLLIFIFSLITVVGILTHAFQEYDEIIRGSIVVVIILIAYLIIFIKSKE